MTRPHHQPSKRHLYPVLVMGLLLAACLLTGLPRPAHAALGIADPKHEQAMLWPLLPGESVNTLANTLYPQSPVLQQRFVQQSIALSRSRGIMLRPAERHDTAQLIVVPNAQALHTLTHRIKKADEVDTESFVTPGLVMSVQLTQKDPHTASRWHLPALNLPELQLPTLQLPTLRLPKQLSFTEYSFSVAHLTRRITALKTHVSDTYAANAQAIARTPVNKLYQTPQLALIVASAILLLVLSVIWGVLEERKPKQ